MENVISNTFEINFKTITYKQMYIDLYRCILLIINTIQIDNL